MTGLRIRTYSGIMMDPMKASCADINVVDIAHALSHLCRFGGHCPRFYSVAEHSVLVAKALLPYGTHIALAGLFHDATEAYMQDLVSPLKHRLPDYMDAEDCLESVIALKLRVDFSHPVIKKFDKRIACDEYEQAFGTEAIPTFGDTWAPLGVKLGFLTPAEAEREFLWQYTLLKSESVY